MSLPKVKVDTSDAHLIPVEPRDTTRMMEGVPVPVRHAVPRLQAGDLVKWRWTNQIGVILYVKYIENDSLTKCYQGDGVMYDAYKSRELWEVVFMLNRPI